MSELVHFPAFVPPRSDRVISLGRPASRTQAPTIRATAVVFEDPASRGIRRDLDRLAPSDASLVIVGETGTGKEIAARYIHEHSSRRGGPFLAVNCGALVDNLVEAELFGYEKGAFTGAIRTQVGWFEAANGGTLLLDEIGDLPLPLQVKLLRVLQEREVVRLGARTPIPVDVRVVAAPNVDLDAAVAEGRFRQGLFFRLNVAAVVLPPRRDGPGDIPPLAGYFLELYRDRMNRPALALGEAALRALLAHPWPGNIRELENVVHNAVLLATGPEIGPSDLRLTRGGERADAAAADLEGELRTLFTRYLGRNEPDLFSRVTETLVTTAYGCCGENQVKAAARLGLSRNAMRTQLARLGIIAARSRRLAAARDPA